MELSREQKQPIREEEQLRLAEDQYRKEVREQLAETAASSSRIKKRLSVSTFLFFAIIAVVLGGFLFFFRTDNGSVSSLVKPSFEPSTPITKQESKSILP